MVVRPAIAGLPSSHSQESTFLPQEATLMWFRMTRMSSSLAVCLLAVLILTAQVGCGTNPFLAANFNQSLYDFLQENPGGPPPPDNGDDGGDDEVLGSVCDLTVAAQNIQFSIQNASVNFVDYSMTFVASAGPGGFVCDANVQDYLNAGYSDAIIPGSGSSLEIGCDVISLLSGTRILTREFGINEGAAARLNPDAEGGDPNGNEPSRTLTRLDNGQPFIPLPELIVLGNADADFECTGDDLCTQKGFVYVNNAGIPTGKAAEVSRIQGTVCAENAGTAPEWRLDRTLDDVTQAFQYARGGAIIVTVLDRATDSPDNTRNQVVWRVTDVNGDTIHIEQP
jgi:hypothetical protein